MGNHNELSKHPKYDEIFCLGLQTREQADNMAKFGGTVLCGDATHGLTQYEFQVFSLVVKDDTTGRGHPVAFLITSNVDKIILTTFFKELLGRNPGLKISTTMCDDDKATRQAFKSAFGDDVNILLCYWHIRKSWKRNLHLIPLADDREEIYQLLRQTLIIRKEEIFLQLMEIIIDSLLNSDRFLSYLRSTYLGRTQEWARCYRNFFHHFVDTNMLLEALHNFIKSVLLKRRPNRRVETLIRILLNMETEIFAQHSVIMSMLDPEDSVPVITARHKRGMKISDMEITKVLKYCTHVCVCWMIKIAL